MAKGLVDLHIHSTASDGSCTPSEIVKLAVRQKLSALALTDHDTISGLEEAEEAGKEHGIEIIRGCELSTRIGNDSIHIVGLFLPRDSQRIQRIEKSLEIFQENRNNRNNKIIEKLQKLAIDVDMEDIIALAQGSVVGRPHIARYLCNEGYVETMKEAFEKYLGKNKLAYVPREAVSPQEACQVLSDVGACAVLAHPGHLDYSQGEFGELVELLIPHGLTAIEVYHSSHSQKEERKFYEIAKKYKLCVSGGSDFHGTSKPNISIGSGKGGLRVPPFVLEELKKYRLERGLEI